MISDEEFDKLINFNKLIADNTRVRILFLLKDESISVNDLASRLNMTKSRVSHQLKLLREGNLVRFEKKGKEVFYTLSDSHVIDVFNISLKHVEEI